jgi:hypothetical protein
MAMASTKKGGMGQIIGLVIVAVVLAAGYVVMDRYAEGQKDMLTVETRGMNMVQALTRHKLDGGSYPDSLDKLVPKFAPAVGRCPDGQAIAYQLSGTEYTLTCQNVIFKFKPYSYDSRTKTWNG